MGQKGKVIKKVGNNIEVKLERHSACKNCGACKLAENDSDMVIKVENYIDAEVGDYVEVDIESRGIVIASIIMYLIPILSLFAGIGLGMLISNSFNLTLNKDLFSVITGLAFMVVSFFGIRYLDKYFKKFSMFRPIIKKLN